MYSGITGLVLSKPKNRKPQLW